MAYKSLYRKYRPAEFKEVCGQEFIIKTLQNAIYNGKVSHAYLFAGTRGTGKTTTAKIFAKAINCLNPKDGKPCGNCEICLSKNTEDIPDIIEIDAASNNGVDEIRELKNKIKLVPVLCKYKVYIIDEVHMLSTGAFNALLKTLEEPPAHVIFILATTEPQKLPITIISRCQRFDFGKLSLEKLEERLKYISEKEKVNISSEALSEISKISDGSMRDAIGILEQVASYSKGEITIDDIYVIGGNVSYKVLTELIEAYLKNNTTNVLNIIEKIYYDGKDFSKLSEKVLFAFRNILISKKASDYFNKNVDISIKEWIVEMSALISEKELESIIEVLERLIREIKRSDYPRILFELFMLDGLTDSKPKIDKPEEVTKSDEEIKSTEEPVKETKNQENVIEEENDKSEEKKDYKRPLINNTIACADAKCKKEIQNLFADLDKYLTDKKYKNVATILKDSSVAAASNDHILLIYKYESMVEENDKEYKKIVKFLKETLKCEYKIVAITEECWKEERPKYLKLKKENKNIILLEEFKIEDNIGGGISNKIVEQDEDSLMNLFGEDIIEEME